MRVYFIVLACTKPPTPEPDPVTGGPCIAYDLTPREDDEFRDFISTQPRAYFVLGVPELTVSTAAQMLDRAPVERFRWLAIDAVQYYEAQDASTHLRFPTQNVFNLAMFSLTWAARWVEEFFSPLNASPVVAHSLLANQRALVFNERPDLKAIREAGWDLLVRDLPSVRGDLDDDLFRKVNFRLGLGSAMQLINDQLRTSSLDQVRTYCPEALFGTVNLWLFSRTYHDFMTTTRDIAHAHTDFNQR